jgi:hypothetical protein
VNYQLWRLEENPVRKAILEKNFATERNPYRLILKTWMLPDVLSM